MSQEEMDRPLRQVANITRPLYGEGHRDGRSSVLMRVGGYIPRERGAVSRWAISESGIYGNTNERTICLQKRDRNYCDGGTTDLDGHYRDFGYYMAEYLEVQEAKYSTDQSQSIGCLVAMQSEQERREIEDIEDKAN